MLLKIAAILKPTKTFFSKFWSQLILCLYLFAPTVAFIIYLRIRKDIYKQLVNTFWLFRRILYFLHKKWTLNDMPTFFNFFNFILAIDGRLLIENFSNFGLKNLIEENKQHIWFDFKFDLFALNFLLNVNLTIFIHKWIRS